LKLAYDVFAFLLSQGIGIAFVSKGIIPAEHMALFKAHPSQIRAQIGLITLNHETIQIFEPGCAPPDVRLRQIEALIQCGIETEARLDPILPGLTDDVEAFDNLFSKLSRLGIRRVALNVLYLRPVLMQLLHERIADTYLRDRLLQKYVPGDKIRVCNGRFSQTALPRGEREEIFAKAIRLAKVHGIACHCCSCMNPDISHQNCNLSGRWEPGIAEFEQLRLL